MEALITKATTLSRGGYFKSNMKCRSDLEVPWLMSVFVAGMLSAVPMGVYASVKMLGPQQADHGSLAPDTRSEQQLRQRVVERWQKLIDGDVAQAYAYETPSYRAAFSLKQFEGRFGTAVNWRGVRVTKLDLHPDEGTAVVWLDVDYEFIMPKTDRVVKSTRRLEERWLFDNDQWWHLSRQ